MKKILFFILLSFVSCSDNNSFYIENQSVISCKNKGIYNLSITSLDTDISFNINWSDSLHQAPSIIDLNNVDNGYKITKYYKWQSKIITNKNFKLMPSKKIIIKRYQGDVVSVEIEVLTNKDGNIISVSQNDCNDNG